MWRLTRSLTAQIKKPERGFATTSTIKKKDPEPEAVVEAVTESSAPNDPVIETATTGDVATQEACTTSNGVTDSWEDSDEKKAQNAEQALAEKVKSLSEKEFSRQMKILEYEKRMSSSYSEFFWDDPTDVVSISTTRTRNATLTKLLRGTASSG